MRKLDFFVDYFFLYFATLLLIQKYFLFSLIKSNIGEEYSQTYLSQGKWAERKIIRGHFSEMISEPKKFIPIVC